MGSGRLIGSKFDANVVADESTTEKAATPDILYRRHCGARNGWLCVSTEEESGSQVDHEPIDQRGIVKRAQRPRSALDQYLQNPSIAELVEKIGQ